MFAVNYECFSSNQNKFTMEQVTNVTNLQIWLYNCKGFKSAFNCIDSVIDKGVCDLVFLCEHWLTPQEVASFKYQSRDNNRWLHMKSSVSAEEQLVGRPYGGVGFIAKKLPGIVYKPISMQYDRVTVVKFNLVTKQF